MSPPTPPNPSATPGAQSAPPSDTAWAPTEWQGRAGAAPAPAAPAQGNALPLGTRLGEFEVLKVLGEGGFGIVYLAQDHMLQRRVAIKEYMPATLARRGPELQLRVANEPQRPVYDAGLAGFVNEARLLARFDHPALVKVHRFWQANGTAYMVMPFYQGITLKQALQATAQPPEEAWLMSLLNDLTTALQVVHASQCYHRDIAPDNILMLADTGKPLLLDFGAARQVIGDATQALTAILKPGYAPIEQYGQVGALKQGPWTDVYALCAVVYCAITGHKPPAAVGRTVNDTYSPLLRCAVGRYSDQLLRAVDRGLRLKPDERPATMAGLRRELGLEKDSAPGPAAHIELDLAIPLDAPPAPSAQSHAARYQSEAGSPRAFDAAAALGSDRGPAMPATLVMPRPDARQGPAVARPFSAPLGRAAGPLDPGSARPAAWRPWAVPVILLAVALLWWLGR